MIAHRKRNSVTRHLRHGLTSRAIVNARAASARELALALISETPHDLGVREAAENIAEAIFALRDIRRLRQEYLSCKAPKPDGSSSGIRESNTIKRDHVPDDLCRVLEAMNTEAVVLNRLDRYERRMRSRYRELVRRFDHLTIEALRRKS